MLGHLQRNKVKPILPIVSLIHSIDSLRLAEELDTQATKAGNRQPVLMQINASEESQKSGVAVGAAVHLAEKDRHDAAFATHGPDDDGRPRRR